jgi:hypothetical protein
MGILKKLKKKVLIRIAIALVAGGCIIAWLNRPVVFYDTLLFDNVNPERKVLARSIYAANRHVIARILVAEADKSNQLIKWVFISDDRLSSQEESGLLDALFEYMQTRNERLTRIPLTWEVFFVSGRTVNSAFVSRLGNYSLITAEAQFHPWYSVPDAGDIVSYETLTKVMLRSMIMRPMYDLGPWPIAEMTPYIPPPPGRR